MQIAKELNISRSGISNCIANISKSAGGYVWRKLNDYGGQPI